MHNRFSTTTLRSMCAAYDQRQVLDATSIHVFRLLVRTGYARIPRYSVVFELRDLASSPRLNMFFIDVVCPPFAQTTSAIALPCGLTGASRSSQLSHKSNQASSLAKAKPDVIRMGPSK